MMEKKIVDLKELAKLLNINLFVIKNELKKINSSSDPSDVKNEYTQ